MEAYNLVSFLGIFILLGFARLFSTDRRRMNWPLIGWGLGLQMLFALFIFVLPAGSRFFLFVNEVVVRVLDSATEGAKFVFGPLALPPGEKGSLGFILAFQGLPTIIFFSALISVLYFYRLMPLVIKLFARLFTRLMRISGAESLCAAGNIFVGVESAITIRPHLAEMTRSELCTVLTAGMATVASNVLALYVFILGGRFPTIAAHLVSASFLSAPAALVMSKILLPERETPPTLGKNVEPHYERDGNVVEAVMNGARAGVTVIVGIAAMLIAFLGLAALVDLFLGAAGSRVNALLGTSIDLSLKGVMGYLFYPFTLVLGVPPADAARVARIIGGRLIVTEVAGYQDLAAALAADALTHPRSAVITAYALCGFAHIASLAIFIGGISALVPSKSRLLSQVGVRALFAATLACLLTACVAGTFFMKGSLLFR